MEATMFSYVRRPGILRQPAPATAGRRKDPGNAAPPPKARQRIRGILGGLAALSLAVAGSLVAAVPSTGAEQKQNYIVVLKDGPVDAGTAATAQQGKYGLAVSTVYRNAVKGYAATMTPSAAARLAADPGVDFISVAREFDQPEDPGPNNQVAPLWWLRMGGSLPDGEQQPLARDAPVWIRWHGHRRGRDRQRH